MIALVSDSETMTLEAMSGLVDVAVSLLAIFVVGKIQEPANSRYHFGYAKYEPLMIGMEGTLVAAVCLGAIAYSYGKNGKPGGGAAVSTAFVSESGIASTEQLSRLEQAGVDAIAASGFEAGGHRGSFLRPAEDSLTGTISLGASGFEPLSPISRTLPSRSDIFIPLRVSNSAAYPTPAAIPVTDAATAMSSASPKGRSMNRQASPPTAIARRASASPYSFEKSNGTGSRHRLSA